MSIELEHVGFSYKDREVLKDVTFSLSEGTLTCLLGPNGVGKSTLFKVILGILKQQTGGIRIGGEDTRGWDARKMASAVAYIPQSHAPVFSYLVIDMVLMGTAPRVGVWSKPRKSERDHAREILKKLGLEELTYREYGKLSGGERQLVLIARALMQGSKILLLDEPTSNLDFGNQVLVMNVLRSLSRQGYIIFIATHQPEHAFLYANRAIALKDGQVLAQGRPAEIITEELMEKLYGIRVHIATLEKGGKRLCVPEDRFDFIMEETGGMK